MNKKPRRLGIILFILATIVMGTSLFVALTDSAGVERGKASTPIEQLKQHQSFSIKNL